MKPGNKVEVRLSLPAELREARGANRSPATPEAQAKQKRLRGRGMLAGVFNSEEFMRLKEAAAIRQGITGATKRARPLPPGKASKSRT